MRTHIGVSVELVRFGYYFEFGRILERRMLSFNGQFKVDLVEMLEIMLEKTARHSFNSITCVHISYLRNLLELLGASTLILRRSFTINTSYFKNDSS